MSMLSTHNYGKIGIHEPPAIALMRAWMRKRGFSWSVRGIHVDKRAGQVFNLPNGTPEELLAGYGLVEDLLDAPVVRPTGYLAAADKDLKLLSPWDGPHAARVAGLGWSNNKEGLPPNPNASAHALIWTPDGTEPRAQITVHSDAPRLDVIHGPTGTFTSALLTWPALRKGLEDGKDVVTAVFEELAAAVEEQNLPFHMSDCFGQVGYGARIGYGLRIDGALWMQGIVNEGDPVPRRFRNFEATISPISHYPAGTKFDVVTCPYSLDLARLAYLRVRKVVVRGTRIPPRQAIFEERCTLTERDEDGSFINASKRVRDAVYGKGVHTGEVPAPEPLYGSAGGFAVYAAV
jgi:hypothetical protein